MYTGKNVINITKVKQSDIFSKVDQTVVGTVNFPASFEEGDVLKLGTFLSTSDGGLTWNSLETPVYETGSYSTDDEVYHEGHIYKSTADTNATVPGVGNWDDLGVWNVNGVLYNDLQAAEVTTVVVTGVINSKNLPGYDEFLRNVLFNNKLLVK